MPPHTLLWPALLCVGTKYIIHTYVRVTTCCCGHVSGLDRASQRTPPPDPKKKNEDESRVHSCVIASQPASPPALVLVYCKHPHANHSISLSLSALWLRASMLPWASFKLCVEACTHMQEHLSMHAGRSHLHFHKQHNILTHAHVDNFLFTPT